MAGPLLSWDKQNSRRRWVIVIAAFTLVLLLFTATSYYRPPSPQALNGRPQAAGQAPSFTNPAQTVSVPSLTKPEGVPVVGFIYFGRRSRVEILRCYIEVRSSSSAMEKYHPLIFFSATWWITVAGLMRCTGCGTQTSQMIWRIFRKY